MADKHQLVRAAQANDSAKVRRDSIENGARLSRDSRGSFFLVDGGGRVGFGVARGRRGPE
eukprot:1392579-Amorphochlora_amoeboformis.AAC.1